MKTTIKRETRVLTKFRQLKSGDVFGIPNNNQFLAIVSEPTERYSTHNAIVISNDSNSNSVPAGRGTCFSDDTVIELVEELKVILIP